MLALLLVTALAETDQVAGFEASPEAGRDLIRLKPSYTSVDAGGDESRVLARLNIAYDSLFIPGLVLPKTYRSVLRVDLRAQSVHTANQNVSGLEDLQIIDVGGCVFAWGGVAAGFGLVLPTATDDALGKGKLQLAPALAVVFVGIRGARLGFIAQNFFDVAGDANRRAVNRLTVQPILSYRFSEALFVSSDPTLVFDWEAGQSTIPLNFQIGHAFSRHLSVALGPEWVVTGDGENDITVNLTMDYGNW